MKNLKTKIKHYFVLAGLFIANPVMLLAQEVDLGDVESEVDDLKDTAFNIIEVIIMIALGIGALYVINQMVANPDQGKKFAVGWVVALVFYVIVFQVLL